ncbi:MAG: hypothetical protein R3Y24_07830 [Eubacteriales bacterium]
MIYMHYCKNCDRLHMLNGHKLACPRCRLALTELRIPYMDYVNLSFEERQRFQEHCRNEEELKAMSTTYRMYKYSKWYRESQETGIVNEARMPISPPIT